MHQSGNIVGAKVGEVRVKARLVNAVDQGLARRGQLETSKVRSYEAEATVDTGSVRCAVPQSIVDALGLNIIGTRVTELADGRRETLPVTEAISMNVLDREEVENALVVGDEVLIGQTFLEKADLWVDCAGQRLVPNPAHPDQPITKLK